MSEEASDRRCLVCDEKLQSEREKSIHVCYECRRYGLLNGSWPKRNKIHISSAASLPS
jgi:hypothetical protein